MKIIFKTEEQEPDLENLFLRRKLFVEVNYFWKN